MIQSGRRRSYDGRSVVRKRAGRISGERDLLGYSRFQVVILFVVRFGFLESLFVSSVSSAGGVASAVAAFSAGTVGTAGSVGAAGTADTAAAAGAAGAIGAIGTAITVDTAGAAAADGRSDTLHLTLPDAIRRALEHSSGLAAMEAMQRGADAAVHGARAAGLPFVELSAGYTRYSDVPEFVLTLPGGRQQSIAPNIPDGWRTRASVSLPLFTGGRIAEAAEAARGERDAVGSDLEAARADLVLETSTAYWSLRLQTESASVFGEALVAYESHLVDARHRADVGLAARSEVLAVEVERGRSELGRVQTEGAAALAQENLRRLLGVGERVVIVASDRPADEQRRLSAGGDWGLAAPITDGALDSLVAAALATRAERTALAARAAAAEARVRSEQGARWPQLAAVAGYDYANPNRRINPVQAEWKETWDASVNLSFPLFDSGRISAATARARAQAEALRQQVIDFDQRIRLEVNMRVIERRTAEKAVAVSERAVDSAQENEKVTRDRYREGVASSSELLDAEVRSLRASLDRTDAQARLLMARANLDRAVGSLR